MSTHFIWSQAAQKVALLLITAIFLFCPAKAAADGMVFDRTSLTPLVPNEQRAVIHHRDGMQNMFIALDLQQDNAVWMFPVPGRPDQVRVDVAATFPRLVGGNADLRRLAERKRWTSFLFLPLMTSIPGMPIFAPYYLSYKRGRGLDVTTHMGLDKFGIHVEVITAGSMEDLEAYLTKHGLRVKRERLAPFKDYLSEKYVLVVGWISSRVELERTLREPQALDDPTRQNNPCLFVRFPSEKGYYPLKATSGYGEAEIPVTLQITGLVTVDYTPLSLSRALHPLRQEENSYGVYYLRGRLDFPDDPKGISKQTTKQPQTKGPDENLLTELSKGPVDYTFVRIKSRAARFTQDLSVSEETPEDVRRAIHYLDNPPHTILILLWVVALSMISGALAGLLVFKSLRPYAFLGLFNLLSFVGLSIAVMVYRRRKGEPPKTVRFVLAYTVVFWLVTFVAYRALPW